jgi:hypothetical protein
VRANRNASGKNPAAASTIKPTAGEVFDDGTVIELIEDLSQSTGLALLKWDGRRIVISPQVVHSGKTYLPLQLEPTVRRALRLPSSCSGPVSAAVLFGELVAVVARFTDLAEHVCCQLVAFVFACRLADCLPAPINLSVWSPVSTDVARVLLLLSCLCRQALALAGTCASDLSLLPPELQATLLIFRPASGRRLREMLAACGWEGFHAARCGRLEEFVGSVALSTDAPLNDRSLDPLIEIPISPSGRPLPVLDKRAQQQLANEFQPKLLRYRLLHHRIAATKPASAEAASAGPAKELATGLCACFSDEPKLRDQQISLLIEAEQGSHGARRTDPRVPLIEVLWSRCHESKRQKLHVAEIAVDLNAVLSLEGDLKLEDRLVGSFLKSLGLRTRKLDRKGRGLKMDPPTRKLIHQLARAHKVPSAETPFLGCPECSPAQPTRT